MNKIFGVLIQISFILILCTKSNDVVHGQDNKQDTIQAKIIYLDQGCKLVLDAKIDLADTVSIEIVDGIRNILPRIQKLIPADSVTINYLTCMGYGWEDSW
jgi:hypothetical protein